MPPELRSAEGRLKLPLDGGAAKTNDGGTYLFFFVKRSVLARAEASLRIGYYFKNSLVQEQQLLFSQESGDYTVETHYTTTKDLTGLDDRPMPARLSIATGRSSGSSHQIVMRSPGADQDGSIGVIEINDENVDKTIKRIRKFLTENAPDRKLRPKSMFETDLRELASAGHELYTQIFARVPPSVLAPLENAPERVIAEVARPAASGFVLPWSYLYEIPLYTGETYTLCPRVRDWDGKRALFDGEPRTCPCGPHERNVICPFGFWGFRYTIEQLSKTDSPVVELPLNDTSRMVIGKTLDDIDEQKLADHIRTLSGEFRARYPNLTVQETASRDKLEELLGSDLPFVYLFCHGRHEITGDPDVVLYVGRDEAIPAGNFARWVGSWNKKSPRKDVWGEVRPLVFINACGSLEIERATAISYLDVMIGRARAAGVIGTEVQVWADLATDVAQSFFTSLLAGKTVDEALRTVRLDYLKQGNMFGLVYTPYCRSNLKITMQ